MLKYLLVAALAAAQLVMVPAVLATRSVRDRPAAEVMLGNPQLRYDAKEAFRFACKVTGYDCKGVPRPAVVEANLTAHGIHGAYQPGTAHITLDTGALPYFAAEWVQGVVVHETVHYLDYVLKYNDVAVMVEHRCEVEQHAYDVEAVWLVESGRPDLFRTNWQESYGCELP